MPTQNPNPKPNQAQTKPTLCLPCPQCRTKTHWHGNTHRPFCSARCKLLDLGDWASERYRLASSPNAADFNDY